MALQKILLVDDDKSFIYLNRTMFKYNQVTCQIDECRNGAEALAYLSSTDKLPDVILLDLNMPVMDGFGFLEKFEQQNCPGKQPRVFVLSSSRSDEEMQRSLHYKCVKGYFEKPLTDVHIKEILSKVNSVKHTTETTVMEPHLKVT